MDDETIMPDGRPLFAWRNELEMYRADADRLASDRIEVDSLMRILRIVQIEEQREHNKGDYLIRVSLKDIVTANSTDEALRNAEITRV